MSYVADYSGSEATSGYVRTSRLDEDRVCLAIDQRNTDRRIFNQFVNQKELQVFWYGNIRVHSAWSSVID